MKTDTNKIILILLLVTTIITLIKSFIPQPENKLLRYKLEQLDKDIKGLKMQQIEIDKKITQHKKDIAIIDSSIRTVRSNRTTINNYYEIKADSIRGMDRKRMIDEFKKRYKY